MKGIQDLLGADSFLGEENTKPWEILLTRSGNSTLAKGISEAWSTLQTNATEISEKL